ncbi:hypothetical protein D6D27_09433 [Aureobasidium pullulans]|nr:hypothetical protein D6D27_09433 [Aureobasidium pullulans]
MAPNTPKVKSTASSSSKSSPKFSWSKRHRQVLLVLQRRGLKDEEIATIFNKLFEKDLRRIGLDGLTRSIVHSQLSKHYRRSCREWQAVEACGEAELTWVLQELNSLDVVSPSRNPSTSVSVVIERPRPLPKVALPVTAERNVFIRFPEDVAISANRTRTVYGQQIPIIRATDQDLIISDPITAIEAHSDLRLSLSMIEGLAQLMLYFGINALAPGGVIASLTSEIIRGFGINLQTKIPKRWEMLAGAFGYALSDDGTLVDEHHLSVVEQAFISGVRTGIGELNWHLDPEKQARMMRKSVQLGLGGVQPMMVGEATTSNAQRVVKSNHQAPVSSQQGAINRRRVDDYEHEDEEAETDIEEEENDEHVDGHTSNRATIDEDAISHGILDQIATAEEMVYGDDIIGYEIDRDTITVAMPEKISDAQDDITTEEEDEAKTDIEGDIGSDAEDEIKVMSSRRISHPRGVTSRSKRIGADIIILDDSDDEDFVMA